MISLKRLPKFGPLFCRALEDRHNRGSTQAASGDGTQAVNAESFGRAAAGRALTDAHLDFLRITLAQYRTSAPPVCTR